MSLKSKIKWALSLIAFIIILAVMISVNPFVKGNPTQIIVAQPMFGSELSCIEGGGWHWKGLAQVYRYNLVGDFYFNSDTTIIDGKEWNGDMKSDEDDIHVRFAKKAEGDIRGHVQYFLPRDCEHMKLIHQDQKSDVFLKHNLIRNKVMDAVNNAALLFNAADVIETQKVEYRDMIKTYLNVGQYRTYTETVYDKLGEDEVDSTGKIIKKADVQKYEVMRLKLDSIGNPIVSMKSDLITYGIKVGTPEIINIDLDTMSQNRIKAIRDKEMTNITNAASAETAKQTAITKEAEGRAKIAEAKAEQEVIKIREVTQAQKEKEVAILNAEREKEVARLNALKAQEDAKRIKAEGEAEAAANRAKVVAGFTPQQKLDGEIQMNKDKWDAISRIQVPIVPHNNISLNGNGGGKGSPSYGIDMLGSAKALETLEGITK